MLGRSILDNVIVSFEVLHAMKRKVRVRQGGWRWDLISIKPMIE